MEGSTGRAHLLEDGGKSAAEAEFFRSSEFMAAENVTHTLVIESDGGVLRAPLKVNPIEGGGEDATSPYGYPGFGGNAQMRIDPEEIDFSETGLVTIFIRNRLGHIPLSGGRERNRVFISNPEREPKERATDRRRAERNCEAGFRTEIVDGPSSSPQERAAFVKAYTQTMERREAEPRYFYNDAYFGQALEAEQSKLVVTRDGDGELAAGSLVTLSDGYIHYYLTGIGERYVEKSPTKNLVRALVGWSNETGIPLCLGGGMKEGDKLAEFKRGFANEAVRLRTSEIVCDLDAYRELCAGRGDSDHFPAYRSAPVKSSEVERPETPFAS